MSKAPVIHWFRRDLRLMDNLALHAALESGAPVIPLFVFDPAILQSERSGAPRLSFMLKGLRALDVSLRERGSGLLIRHGKPEQVIPQIIAETNAQALYFNRDYSPFARRRDERIQKATSVPVHSFDDALLVQPGEVMTNDGSPYQVYTPFKKKWNEHEKPGISTTNLDSANFHSLDDIERDPIPTLEDLDFPETIDIPETGETTAQARLEAFVADAIYSYKTGRNKLICDPFSNSPEAGTSYLSPYFRFGMLSPRQAYWAARDAYQKVTSEKARESVTTWVSELTWREFYMHILYHFPHVDRHNFRREYDDLQWRAAPDDLQAWKDGQTGYPVVDAAMRQLKHIGWMPNRARMIVASFLTKDLLIHWQEGELHFMQWLIDGDPAANNGGWQWAAGTGTDAQPYFRIFNPVSQSEKFATPDYLRHWIPELKDVPDQHIHAPWEMDSPPASYPTPIVEHQAARERTLEAFKAIKEG